MIGCWGGKEIMELLLALIFSGIVIWYIPNYLIISGAKEEYKWKSWNKSGILLLIAVHFLGVITFPSFVFLFYHTIGLIMESGRTIEDERELLSILKYYPILIVVGIVTSAILWRKYIKYHKA
jgi:heme/copper-type cytochrome/quinol oxidase subunit 2